MEKKRIIIDVSPKEHSRFKMKAAEQGISIREMFLEAVKLMEINACKTSSHIPNKKTRKAMKNAEEGKNLIRGKEAEAFFKKIGM